MVADVPEFGQRAERYGSLMVGLLIGYLVAAICLVALQTLPLNREMRGLLHPEPFRRAGLIMPLAPDYQLVALSQLTKQSGRLPWEGEKRASPITALEQSELYLQIDLPIRYAVWREMLQTWNVVPFAPKDSELYTSRGQE